MKTPDQLERKIRKYFKVDLSDQETLEKLKKAKFLNNLQLIIWDKISSFTSIVFRSAMKKGNRRGLERELLRKELKPFSYDDDLLTRRKTERLRSIIDKALRGEDLNSIEYNWLLSELKKF